MHASEKLIRMLENASVNSYAEYAYRIVAEKWRDVPLSAIGSLRSGGRYNAPSTFPVLYCADSQLTAMMEVEALFATADGQLKGAPRNPDLVLTVGCTLSRVVDLTVDNLYADLGTTLDELTSLTPSRFILNTQGKETPYSEAWRCLLLLWKHLCDQSSKRRSSRGILFGYLCRFPGGRRTSLNPRQ